RNERSAYTRAHGERADGPATGRHRAGQVQGAWVRPANLAHDGRDVGARRQRDARRRPRSAARGDARVIGLAVVLGVVAAETALYRLLVWSVERAARRNHEPNPEPPHAGLPG